MATEQQVDDMIYELGQLVETLRQTTRTTTATGEGSAQFDRSTKALIMALGKLSAAMDAQVKTKAQEKKAVEQFTKEIENATKVTEKQTKAAEETIQVEKKKQKSTSQQMYEELRERRQAATNWAGLAAQEIREQEKANKSFRNFLEKRAGDDIEAQRKLQGRLEALNVVGDLTGKMVSFGKELAEGMTQSGVKFSSLGPLIDGIANALGKAAEAIPIAGELISGGLKAAAEGSKFLLGQIQVSLDAFHDLSRVGALTADGMSGVQRQFLTSAMSLNGFKKAVSDNAAELARFGGTVGRGAEDFSKIVGDVMDSEVGDSLRRLGINADEFGENTAKYIAMQNRLGLAQGKTNKELSASSATYARELDQLARLTGQSREAAQKQIDAAMREARFRSTIEIMNRENRREEAKTLTFFQGQVAGINDELGQAIRDISTGFIGDSEAAQKFIRAGVDLESIVEGVKSGQLTAAQATARLQKELQQVEGNLTDFARYLPPGSSPFPDLYKTLEFTRAKISESGELSLADADKLAKGQDKLTNNTVDAQKALEQVGRQLANFGNTVMPAATTAVAGFTKSLNAFIQGVSSATGIDIPSIDTSTGSGGGGGGGAGGGGGGGAAATAKEKQAQSMGTAFNAKEGGGLIGAVGRAVQGLKEAVAGPGGSNYYSRPDPASNQSILDFIGKLESQGKYDMLVGNKTLPELTSMTVAEVQEFQKSMISKGYKSTALGKYQIKESTLDWLVKSGAISKDDIFNQATQDRAGLALLKLRGLDQYRVGKMSRDSFADNLAKEWAALPLANGNSYYQGQNTNKALTSRGELLDAISAAQGGVARGPKGGYRAILHGTEAIVPLPDGKNIPVALSIKDFGGIKNPFSDFDISSELKNAIGESGNMGAMFSESVRNAIIQAVQGVQNGANTGNADDSRMVAELQNIANLLARQNSTSERILQVARN